MAPPYHTSQPRPPSDSTWPVDYPYECVNTWTHPSNQTLSIVQGTQGRVVSLSKSGYLTVTRPYLQSQQPAHVPASHVLVGVTRKYGDVYIDVPEFYSRFGSEVGGMHGQLDRAVAEWLERLHINRYEMHWLPIWFQSRTSVANSRRQLVQDILRGIPDATKDILNMPDFTVQDVATYLPSATDMTTPGVYTRIYLDYDGQPNRLASQYVGKSINPSKRHTEHEYSTEPFTTSNHYKRAVGAKKRYMRLLWQPKPAPGSVDYTKSEIDHLMAIVEQLFVDLFECYCEEVYSYQPHESHNSSANLKEQEDKLARYMQDKTMAHALTVSAQSSFVVSNWPGASSRTSYGAEGGCNWVSPLTEINHADKMVWTLQSFASNNLDVFRRSATRITSAETPGSIGDQNARNLTFHVVSAPNHGPGQPRPKFSPTIAKNLGLRSGQWIFPCIEMTKDGSPHHRNWAHLPTIGPWKDWDRARSWALKIEWQEPATSSNASPPWKHAYIRSQKPMDLRKVCVNKPDAAGSHQAYAQGIAIYRMLRQIKLEPEYCPNWMIDYGIAHIKQQYLDFLSQTIRIRNLLANARSAEFMAGRLDPFQMSQAYIAQGLTSYVPFGAFNGQVKNRVPQRACDSCYLLNVAGRWKDESTNVRATLIFINFDSN
ncbi:uncharacterized protein HMPREF1541_03077 [Cyphellophora europaea CBS 101466]|uniref:Uncharacterized protein n=1 Tax=Cyphellophora europaea (strain CBS 101466) TaxID=1220924 RepID=W2RXG2_CYPE1|nr:uncharacterized protein HMPREF1541_03077 [Cyphellophora europaea CBS 101466]ETN41142.1 hypothetical protein HMPREF1541_03077 [Cyphellophora europaea CBS 101466]